LDRRLAIRVREADADAMDREKEQRELDDLRNKIFSGEYDNPTQEFERVSIGLGIQQIIYKAIISIEFQLKKEREDLYRPKILIDVNLEQSQQREKELEREKAREIERQRVRERTKQQKERYVLEQASRELASVNAEPIDSDSQDGSSHDPAMALHNSKPTSQREGSESRDSFNNVNSMDDDMSRNSLLSNTPTPNSPSMSNQGSGANNLLSGTGFSLNLNAKKKKIDVKDVFAMDDEGEEINGPKKRKLVPLGEYCWS
jgi:RNA-binding protein 25